VHESQAKILHQKLNEAKVANELKIYPTEGHGWNGPNLFDSFQRIVVFLKKHVGAGLEPVM
jgi:dipeptidyl aminopeptidase/acylaminoacyl peptidase